MTRIPHYPYAKAPKVWALLGFIPQSIQYMICKSACERMLRNNTSPEYYPDQFLQGGKHPGSTNILVMDMVQDIKNDN